MTELKRGAVPEGVRQTSIGSSKLLFLACWLVYACSYIARGNFSFARSLMIDDAVLSAGVAGTISAVYFICYAAGQLVNGALADRISPFLMVSIGLVVVSGTNLAMTFAQPAPLLCVWWGINGFGQSMLWSPVFFIISNILHDKVRFFAVTIISLCTPAGKTTCSLLSGLALRGGKWASVFYMASFAVAAILILWIAVYLTVRRDVTVNAPGKTEEKNKSARPEERPASAHPKLALFSAGGLLVIIPSLLVHGLFYNGVVEVIPSILSGEYGLSASAAALLDTVIPIIGVSGVFFSNFVYIRMFRRNELKGAFFCMAASVVPVAIMLLMSLGARDGYVFGQYADATLFVVSYAVIYVLQLAFGHIVISLMAMRYSKFSLAATVSGLCNAANYGGSAIATYGMSYAVESLPLYMTALIWLGCLAVAIVSLFLATRKWTVFIKQNDLM